MLKFLTFIIVLLNFVSLLFNQENNQTEQLMVSPTPLPGMRNIVSNIPDISITGDFYGKRSNNESDPEKNKLVIRSIEAALQGYVYPEIRADIFLAMHKHKDHLEPELCEAKLSFLRVFNNIGIDVGKIHINFGKINPVHQHHRPYVDQPQVITNFFGEHGLVGEGISFSYLFPLPFFARLDIGLWQIPEHHHEENIETEEFGLANEVYNSKLWLSFPTGKQSELEIGINAVTGMGLHYTHHKDKVKVVGLDLTYKLWPSAYTRFVFQSEFLYLIREIPLGEIKRFGFYSYLGYKFNKYWSAGVRYDSSEDVFPHLDLLGTPNVSISNKTASVSLIITKNLTETTHLRFQYKYYFEGQENIHEGFLQTVFGIGPHSHMLE